MLLPHPDGCRGCVLDQTGRGFAPADGPTTAPICLVGEALGQDEAHAGRPFVGAAGAMLSRLLGLVGWARESVRIANIVSCQPPNNWLEGAPWMHGAIQHCAVHRDPILSNPAHRVIVPLGSVALKTVLGLHGHRKVRAADFHGTQTLLPSGQIVVPTFHPSFLQRGASNLIGTVLWDLRQAEAARDHGKPADPASLVVDPPLEWFRAWVDQVVAARQQDPQAYPISSDVETPDKAGGKDEGEISADDQSYQILRQNFSCHPDEGVTVPHAGPFIDEIARLYASPGPIWQWNKEYDTPRLIAAQQLTEADHARVVDLMWLWHYLQSDLPRGLGFAAPFYSSYGAWKHLADSAPARYGAIDGLQTHRVGFGVIGDLQQLGMYAGALRHVHQLHHLALRPAQRIGVKIDRARLQVFKADLTAKAAARLETLGKVYPETLLPLTPKQGLTRRPLDNVLHAKATAFTRSGEKRAGKPTSELKQELYAKARVVEKILLKEVRCCATCGAIEVQQRHRCQPRGTDPVATADLLGGSAGPCPRGRAARRGAGEPAREPVVSLQVASVTRFFWQEPFNPDSPAQVLAYLQHRGHAPGKAKHTHKDTTNRETLERLEKKHGATDPFYRALLDYRAIAKVKGTYVEGTERLLDKEDRLHPTFTFKPSTMRLSATAPNIQNVVSDRGGPAGLASGFRACVVASPGCRLLEVDLNAVEACEVAWFCRDPEYLRLATLGVHAGLASHILGRPYDPKWSNADIAAYFAEIKKHHRAAYDPAKRFVHGRSYGLTIAGMVLQFPDLFPTQKIAEQYSRTFAAMAPAVPAWQTQTQQRAARQHYLGGPGEHPFGYKHWFWSIYTYKRLTAAQASRLEQKARVAGVEAPIAIINGLTFRVGEGEDAKRAVAYLPQSTAAGVLKGALLRLFDPDSPSYIGDAYFGQTPLRAPIHDSLLLEVPDRQWDRVLERVCLEMQRPIAEQPLTGPLKGAAGMGDFLQIGVAAKAGADWQAMEDVAVPRGEASRVDAVWTPAEAEDAEESDALARAIA